MKLDRTAKATNDYPILQPGEYDFEVADATHKLSSSGNRMWEMKLRFEQKEGPDVTVFDYLVETNADWAVNKFNSFLNCIGSKLDDTDKLADTIGEIGKAVVKIEKGKDGYDDKNKVAKYLPKEGKDDLPF